MISIELQNDLRAILDALDRAEADADRLATAVAHYEDDGWRPTNGTRLNGRRALDAHDEAVAQR
jgi:hypothetical protein